MSESTSAELQELLVRASNGDQGAEAKVFELLYDELRKVAEHVFASEPKGHTLQPTAVVAEVWLKLRASKFPDVTSRNHFKRIVAHAMKQVLIDHARHYTGGMRPLREKRVPCDLDKDCETPRDWMTVLEVHDALEQLKKEENPIWRRAADVVELRYFGGNTVDEAAEILGISSETANNDWTFAKAWLRKRLADG